MGSEEEAEVRNNIKDGLCAAMKELCDPVQASWSMNSASSHVQVQRSLFKQILEHKPFRHMLYDYGVDIAGLYKIANDIFALVAKKVGHAKEEALPRECLVNIIMSMRNDNVATVKDVIELRCFMENQENHRLKVLRQMSENQAFILRLMVSQANQQTAQMKEIKEDLSHKFQPVQTELFA